MATKKVVNEFRNIMDNPPEMELEPISIICSNCGDEFIISPAEQKFYKAKGFELPKKCKECRNQKFVKKTIVCVDCGKQFEFDGLSEQYYKSHGLEIPKRCKQCRNFKKLRRSEKEAE